MRFFSLVIFSLCLLLLGCNKPPKEETTPKLFKQIPSAHSSIDFQNVLKEDEEFNIIEYLYFYNGGGVAIGDINNDGLSDIYFSSNQQSNRLYLNKGSMQFEDITKAAGVGGDGNWKTGVVMADVNADGWLDIYVCGVGQYKKFNGYNQLLINNGDLTFTERSKEYGLNFQGFSTHSAFFDYDRDGDLDMYLLNHSVHSTRSYGNVALRKQSDPLAGDRLYQNQLIETGKTYFKDVTRQAGIFSSPIGYGLGLGISDFNRDGYLDIYVSNDFHENDYMYINNHDGTFSEQSKKSLEHTSRFSMGNEIADLNNDHWTDIITLDMLPRDESVIKTSAGEDSYEVYRFKLNFGYGKQVSRNTLQINNGLIDSGRVVFSDVAQAAGLEASDWSWCPLAADFDGDGRKDIFISNGIVRRPNDLDYINFISNDSTQKANQKSDLALADQMPPGKVSNYIFQNRGNLEFEDVTDAWGLSLPGLSNGAAYGDLDNDGDLDLVVNQINSEALLYQNQSDTSRFVSIRLESKELKGNPNGIGSKVILSSANDSQSQELMPSRGFCSSSDIVMIFGGIKKNSTAQVIWPDGRTTYHDLSSKHNLLKYSLGAPPVESPRASQTLLKPQTEFDFTHREDEFNAFNRESLIPHMLSTEGPPLISGDVNGDGLEDVFVGGAKSQEGIVFTQTQKGDWVKQNSPAFGQHAFAEDTDAAFFDADGDKDLDLIVVSGGQEEMNDIQLLAPRLYLNDGRGKWKHHATAFSKIYLQASCVKPFDYDRDGDMDLFIGASVMPFLYGMSPMSFLLQNDGSGNFSFDPSWLGRSTFDNPTRVRPGMVKDAAWLHVNNDSLIDLVLVGEWMPITILEQQSDHRFLNQTSKYGLDLTRGWWNTIETGDIDNDGDSDLIVGNLGLNSRIKASPSKPLSMYLGDFDSNGGSDHIMVYFNGDKSYPFPSRDQLVKQIPSLKKKFLKYSDYRDVKLEDIITPVQKGNAALMQVEVLTSVVLKNVSGKFILEDLPREAQYFPVFDIQLCDINHDQYLDALLVGNLNATQPDFGSYDAGLGLALLGNGQGGFSALRPDSSGFVVRGEGRNIAIAKAAKSNDLIYLVSRNNASVLSFKKRKSSAP